MTKEIKRMWINQPSTLQPHHALHGTNVLAQHEYDDTMRIYFLSGDKVSQQVSKLALSEGWRPTRTSEDSTAEQRSQASDVQPESVGLTKSIDGMLISLSRWTTEQQLLKATKLMSEADLQQLNSGLQALLEAMKQH